MNLTEDQRERIQRNKATAMERQKQAASRLLIAQNGLSAPTLSTIAPAVAQSLQSMPSLQKIPILGAPMTGLKMNNATTTNSNSSFFHPKNNPVSNIPQPLTAKAPPIKPAVTIAKVHVLAVMVSADRFEVKAKYSEKLIAICKTFKSHAYDAGRRSWTLSFKDYMAFDSTMSGMKIYFEWERFPRWIVDVFVKGMNLVSKVPEPADVECKLPGYLFCSLMPYQLEGVKFGVRNHGKVFIADDMGLGKTIQAIALATYYKEDSWPVLCVCPTTVRNVWRTEWMKWLKLQSHEVVMITDGRQTDSLIATKVVIMSYDLLVGMEKLCVGRFSTIVIDESHNMKTHTASRTKAASAVAKHAKRVILLSGTPALSRPQELFSQLHLLNRGLFRGFPEFGVRYCAARKAAYGTDYSGVSNVEELQLLMENTVMIRRLKADVEGQHALPPKRREVVVLDAGDVQSQMKELKAASQEYEQKKASATYLEIRSSLFQFFQQTGKAKLPAVLRYIKEFLDKEPDRKAVVFAHHVEVLEGLHHAFYKKYGGIMIYGATTGVERQQSVATFQNDPSCRVAVLSIGACSTGITMTAASIVFFAELSYNPGILVQAEDRVHRIGQQNNVTIKYLVARGTADDDLWTIIERKWVFLADAGLTKDSFKQMDTTAQSSTVPAVFWDGMFADELAVTADAVAATAEDDTDSRDEPTSKRIHLDENVAVAGGEEVVNLDTFLEDDPDDDLFANYV